MKTCFNFLKNRRKRQLREEITLLHYRIVGRPESVNIEWVEDMVRYIEDGIIPSKRQ
jgi:hypothetical protein